MEGLSIIISAWKSKPYIKGCLDSIYNSTTETGDIYLFGKKINNE